MVGAPPAALLALLVLPLVPVSGLCLGYAVGTDARARGANGVLWGLSTLLFFFVAVPAYLVYRADTLPDRSEPPSPTERRVGAFGVGGVAALLVGSIISPPDPFSLALYTLPLLIVFVPAARFGCYKPGWRALGG